MWGSESDTMMRCGPKGLLLLFVCGAFVCLDAGIAEAKKKKAPAAAADSEAAELDAMGKKAYRKKRWDDAIDAFTAAYEADPLPKYLFNLARCFEKKGDLGRAAHYFDRYIKAAPEAKDRKKVRALARMLKSKLKRTHRKLEFSSKPTGAYIRIALEGGSGNVAGTTPFSEWLPFGAHGLEAQKEGHTKLTKEFLVQPKMDEKLLLTLKPEVSAPQQAAASLPPPSKTDPSPKPAVSKAEPMDSPGAAAAPASETPKDDGTGAVLTAMGAGMVLMAGGAAFGVMADSGWNERDDLAARAQGTEHGITYDEYKDLQEQATSNAYAANILLGTGAGVLAAGIAYWILVGGEDGLAWAPVPLGGGVGVGVRGSISP